MLYFVREKKKINLSFVAEKKAEKIAQTKIFPSETVLSDIFLNLHS
jgi:hypothetical protein